MSYWISTDLDGTLIDHHDYSYSKALNTIERCRKLNIPILLNTSKTFAETEKLHTELRLDTPLIVENGSAIILPRAMPLVGNDYQSSLLKDDRHHIRFGASRSEILNFLTQVRNKLGYSFEGFSDWNTEQISDHTGLSTADAKLALMKEYSEPLLWQDSQERFEDFVAMSSRAGFQILRGGRFLHILGKTDKAKPLLWLQSNLNIIFPHLKNAAIDPRLICLGDGQNDIAMLNMADIPVCVRSPVSPFPQLNASNDVIYTRAYGPEGWAEAIQTILSN